MANKEQITASIQQGISDVGATFGSLSDEQLATRVHQDDGAWTAKDVLAHLAGREQVYQLMQGKIASPFGQGGPNIDQFNDSHVQSRKAKSRDELLDEFRQVHEQLAQDVQGLDDATLDKVVNMGPRQAPLGDLLAGSGGRHSSAHAKEVADALQAKQ